LKVEESFFETANGRIWPFNFFGLGNPEPKCIEREEGHTQGIDFINILRASFL